MWVCDSTNNVTLQRWYNLDCSGSPNLEFDLIEMASMYDTKTKDIIWKCGGTKNPTECSMRYRVYDIAATDVTCSGYEYSDYALVTNVCVYSDLDQVAFLYTCAQNQLTVFTYSNHNCTSGNQNNITFVSTCEQLNNTGPFIKLQITCDAPFFIIMHRQILLFSFFVAFIFF